MFCGDVGVWEGFLLPYPHPPIPPYPKPRWIERSSYVCCALSYLEPESWRSPPGATPTSPAKPSTTSRPTGDTGVALLVNGEQAVGTYTVQFDATHLASGLYLYRLTAGSQVKVKKMMLLK